MRWTISDLTQYIRQMFELDSHLQNIEVIGEVSNLRVPSSGHAYFTLKDSGSQLRCVMWANIHRNAPSFKDGDQVVAGGHLSVYERDGQYQLYCRRITPAGVGDLYAQYEALKARLQEEGLFDAENKLMPPAQPRTIGVVTSPSTAALQDLLNVLRRRNPMVRVVLSGAPVQGGPAAPEILDALGRLEAYHAQHRLDAVLIVRGGGSIEDLWCFNDEHLVRGVAAAAQRLPIVAGVGHEIDFTLIDFAASVRAPTPSAAAELITPVTVDEQHSSLQVLASRLHLSVHDHLAEAAQQVDWLRQQLQRLSPQGTMDNARQHIDSLLARAERATHASIGLKRAHLTGLHTTLQAYSPQATLDRGYAIVQDDKGQIIRRSADTQPGQQIAIRLAEGQISAHIIDEETPDG
ncbi:MAG: exodeoxyribonuclease VII large subunit [Chloroflexi bacterium]|nr:exodeoxyribonuclease VII large subunit [Chloroflexota bacterium]